MVIEERGGGTVVSSYSNDSGTQADMVLSAEVVKPLVDQVPEALSWDDGRGFQDDDDEGDNDSDQDGLWLSVH